MNQNVKPVTHIQTIKRLIRALYPSNLEMLGSARLTWFVDAAAI